MSREFKHTYGQANLRHLCRNGMLQRVNSVLVLCRCSSIHTGAKPSQILWVKANPAFFHPMAIAHCCLFKGKLS